MRVLPCGTLSTQPHLPTYKRNVLHGRVTGNFNLRIARMGRVSYLYREFTIMQQRTFLPQSTMMQKVMAMAVLAVMLSGCATSPVKNGKT